MGLLNWWNDQKQQEDQQLSLIGESKPVRSKQRVDSATTNKMFRAAIQEQGGDRICQEESSVALSQELFDMPPNQVYKTVGGKAYDRSSLPGEVEAAWMAGEVLATHSVDQMERKSIHQEGINAEITETVRASGKQTRRQLKW